MLRKSEELIY